MRNEATPMSPNPRPSQLLLAVAVLVALSACTSGGPKQQMGVVRAAPEEDAAQSSGAMEPAAATDAPAGEQRAATAAAPAAGESARVPADAALEALLEGNRRYLAGVATPPRPLPGLAAGADQPLRAVILACSDSGVPPEITFDAQAGELFVVQLPGSAVDSDGLSALDYAVGERGAPLIVVLGHYGCESILAVLDAGSNASPSLTALRRRLGPALEGVDPSAPVVERQEQAVQAVVRDTVARLQSAALGGGEGGARVVGAVQRVESGRVELLPEE